MLPNTTLSNVDRLKARSFLATLPNWLTYRAANGLNVSQVSSSSQVWQIAADLNATDTLCAYMASDSDSDSDSNSSGRPPQRARSSARTQRRARGKLALLDGGRGGLTLLSCHCRCRPAPVALLRPHVASLCHWAALRLAAVRRIRPGSIASPPAARPPPACNCVCSVRAARYRTV